MLIVLLAFAAAGAWFHEVVTRDSPGRTFNDCPRCPVMVVVPPGSFYVGSPRGESGRYEDEGPRRVVRHGRPFAMAVHEVTVAQYREFADATGRADDPCHANLPGRMWVFGRNTNRNISWRTPSFDQEPDHPVVCVSHQDAAAYAGWLSARTGHTYRLPSEAEWEYVARAGDHGAAPWAGKGSAAACRYENVLDQTLVGYLYTVSGRFPNTDTARCADGAIFTRSTAAGPANAFGVRDMLGNVSEWVADCDNDGYASGPVDGRPRTSGDCGRHLLRGGSWLEPPRRARYAFRLRAFRSEHTTHFGFRVRRDLPCGPWCEARSWWNRALELLD